MTVSSPARATSSASAPTSPVKRHPAAQYSNLYSRPSSRLLYRLLWLTGRMIWFKCVRMKIIRPEAMKREGGYLLASTHLGNLEPFVLGIIYRRRIEWMTRIEFFGSKFTRWILPRSGAFVVNRQGVPVSAIRNAIDRVKRGRVVGICPEGGVKIARESACRGGSIKRGACLVAYRTGAPIVPVVMIGTHDLNRAGPWLPFRRARLWAAFGTPILPMVDAPDRRAERKRMAEEIERQYVSLYQELLEKYGIDDKWVP
jgi:1-acyl-sn-glycerol-3-phosphate acyltransferase